MSDFKSLGLSQPLLSAVEALGFEEPTEIQEKAIPYLLKGNSDLVGLAQTGTGKTAAFGLPLLQLIDVEDKTTQALVLAPTRELCIQITKEMELFAKNLRKIKIRPVYGGTNISTQIRSVKAGVHVIVATPGRLKDLQNRKVVNLKKLRILVLDEADEMLNMGFKPEIDHILRGTSDDKVTWLFSATMPDEVRRISENYMRQPMELSVGQRNSSNADIDHQFVSVNRNDRYDTLTRFLDSDDGIFGLIFCRTRRDTKKLAKKLTVDGYRADALHGDLSQAKRDKVMGKFRDQRLQVLVATDVAARGIDVQNITHVFHYNIPDDLSFYTHRAGRTGRAGQKGISLVFAQSNDRRTIKQLERIIQARFSQVDIPSATNVAERQKARSGEQLQAWLKDFRNMKIHAEAKTNLMTIVEDLEGLSKKDILLRIGTLAFQGQGTASRDNGSNRERRSNTKDSSEKKAQASNGAFQRMFINIGSMDVEGKGDFISLIADHSGIKGKDIGKIEMNRKHTYFEVNEKVLDVVVAEFDQCTLDGRDIRVNVGGHPKGEKKKKDKRKKKR